MQSIRNIILEEARICQERVRKHMTEYLPPDLLEFSIKQILTDANQFARAFTPDEVPISRALFEELLNVVLKMPNLTSTNRQILMECLGALKNEKGYPDELAN